MSKKNSNFDKFRSRKFSILIYPEWNNYKEIIKIIEMFQQYVYIKHVGETEEKKEHIHVYLAFLNLR